MRNLTSACIHSLDCRQFPVDDGKQDLANSKAQNASWAAVENYTLQLQDLDDDSVFGVWVG
jgi:hypothetical protein